MNLQSVHYFIMLARERNFTRAAGKLHITQQTLSANMASLERELGTILIIRHTPLELTNSGKAFYQYALRFAEEEEAMKRSLTDITEGRAGELRIGIGFLRGKTLLPPLVDRFRKEYPKVIFHLQETSNRDMRKKLIEGELDLAIAHYRMKPAGIHVEPVYWERIALLLPKKLLCELGGGEEEIYRKLMGDRKHLMNYLEDCPFLSASGNNIAGYVESRYLEEAEKRPFVRLISNNMETLLDLCHRGLGALFTPENLARSVLSAKEMDDLYTIPLPETEYTISIGYKEKSPPWSIRDDFIRMAKEEWGKSRIEI